MRVTDRTILSPLAGQANAQRAGAPASRFSLGKGGAVERSSMAQGAAPAGALDGLIALQASGDSLERRKRAVRRGSNLLDTLDQLKIALLSGRVSPAQLTILQGQLKQRAEAIDDPTLADILAHIELRAEVELAKLGHGGG